MNETEIIEPESMAVAVRDNNTAVGKALGVNEILSQVRLIQDVMGKVMQEGEHYGKIPGCGEKKTLLQPGAQKLTMTFRLTPEYQIQETNYPNGHKEYRVICTLKSMGTGAFVGQGVGCCSTLESKYRYRGGARKCPECGKETIIKGKAEYGGGWLCFQKKGGCGAKWADGAQEIESQSVEKVENPDPADHYNTVLKMAKKRAFVDATITATAASDIFTQDIGDNEDDEPTPQPAPKRQESAKPVHKAELSANPKDLPAFLERCKAKLLADADKIAGRGYVIEYMIQNDMLLASDDPEKQEQPDAASIGKLFPSVPDKASPATSAASIKTDAEKHLSAIRALAGAGEPPTQPQTEAQELEPEQKPLPAGTKQDEGVVEHVSMREGTSKKGAWVLFGVKIDGEWHNTFDTKLGSLAQSLEGQRVAFFYTEGEKGRNLVGIELAT